MRREIACSFSAVVLSVGLLVPAALHAQNTSPATSGSDAAGAAEAAKMVSAQVALKDEINAGKAKEGDAVRTTLAGKVKLNDGTELPSGTLILGTVVKDDAEFAGSSKLAITFNKAQLKNGKTIAIKATIVGVYPPQSQDLSGNPISPGNQGNTDFATRPDAVDELGALPGVDLHSKISNSFSGVLVSTSHHDVNLKWGSELALAIAPQSTTVAGE